MRVGLVIGAVTLIAGCGAHGIHGVTATNDGVSDASSGGSRAFGSDGQVTASVPESGASPADAGYRDGGTLDVESEQEAGDSGQVGGGIDDAGPRDGGRVGDPSGVAAVRVSDFLASVGVCTHVAQGVDDPQQSATAIAYAGIRNLRDDGNPAAVPQWISMHQQSGVRVCMLPKGGDVATTISMAKQLQAAGALLAIEGPNEPNNWPVTYLGQTSNSGSTFLPVAQFQRDLYAAVHAESALSGIPVFASSEAGGSEPDNVGLQFLAIPDDAGTDLPVGTKYADYANTHNYVSGHSNQLADNVCWKAEDPTLNGDWDGLYVEYGHTWNKGFAGYSNTELVNLSRVTTETGWATTGTGSITQEQQGRLFLNLYLAAYRRGWTYTFIYMLRDDPSQGYFGLFDTNYRPKPSGTYLHNLTAILADTGASNPGLLDYSIPNQPPTVHDLLMQKSDGTFELALWNERPSGGSDNVAVDLGGVRPVVLIYDPTTGVSATQTLANVSSLQVTLSDHPLVLEI